MRLLPKEAGAYITKHAKWLKINETGVDKIVDEVLKGILDKSICIDRFSQNGYHPNPAKDGAQFAVNWIFVCDTLNFCFWTPEDAVKWRVENETGYFACCTALNRALKEGFDITNAKYYAEITEDDVRKIFRGDDGVTEIPLLQERVKCLHEVGKILLEKYDGTFVNCIKKAGKSAKELLNLIVKEFPCFRDEATYNGLKVAIYKRAQILVGDIWACFKGEGYGELTDVNDSITMFADYRVPQVLVYFGALEYSRTLMDILDSNILIPNGSEYEVEIRGASIHITELIKERLLARIAKEHPELSTKFVNSILLDHFLWDYRRQHNAALEERNIPFHKTISVYY
ncbi:queuosine 5'-phosphate N-glycosylase/hydrolase [Culicoides brevitarsis]|uniref:queuosine 5'-phosphate N-glycosylase/hydrolase n=1 Tax=Culicoides brevitarsis TaxID=469753 RepID=UPI00307C7A27